MFRFGSLEELERRGREISPALHFSRDFAPLGRPVSVGPRTVKNSLAVNPMEGCDGNADGSPGELTMRRYGRLAAGGAGLLWLEATAVTGEGRANPRQLWLRRETFDAFCRLREHIAKSAAESPGGEQPLCVLQLTHSGRFSKPHGVPAPVVACHDPYLSRVHIDDAEISPITDGELERLEEAFEAAAELAQRAGFDGVDVKSCHRYLCSELLAAFERPGRFGGGFEGRTRFLLDTVKRMRARVRADFLVTTRLSLYDGFPLPFAWGAGRDDWTKPDLTEPLRLAGELEKAGVRLLNLTMGCPYVNPNVNRPSDRPADQGEEDPLAGVARLMDGIGKVQKAYPRTAVVGTGFSWLRQYAPYLMAGELEAGAMTFAGCGRESFACPDFAARILGGGLGKDACCLACGKCTELMRAGARAGCVVRDREIYLAEYRRFVRKKA